MDTRLAEPLFQSIFGKISRFHFGPVLARSRRIASAAQGLLVTLARMGVA